MENKLDKLTQSYEDMRKAEKKKRDAKEAGLEEPESDVTKVKKTFKKKLAIE